MAANKTASPELVEAVVEPIVEAVVARGRCVIDGEGKRKLAGETVMVLGSEVASLREAGFIVDPNAKPIPVQQGPKLSASDGPGVTRLA